MNILAFAFPHLTMEDLLSKTLVRLTLAAVLGGIIGLERELKRKPAGLRTNIFICFGAAMFTILSSELAKDFGIGDRTRIAAQIIPGIGFIGAGSILHDKGGVSGLTTAATIWVVAALGIAIGAGYYIEAAGTGALVTIVLATIEELPHKQIAEILDIPEGTVAWRVNEARRLLRQRLAMTIPATAVRK